MTGAERDREPGAEVGGWDLRLYIAAAGPRSQAAVQALRRVCQEDLAGRPRVQVVDVTGDPRVADREGVRVLPTLIRREPGPTLRIVGGLGGAERLRTELGIATARSVMNMDETPVSRAGGGPVVSVDRGSASARRRIAERRRRLRPTPPDDLEQAMAAIRRGEIDAVLVDGPGGLEVRWVDGQQQPLRLMVEQMHEGAVHVSADGQVLYCNGRFAQMVRGAIGWIVGAQVEDLFAPEDREALLHLVEAKASEEREVVLLGSGGVRLPVRVRAHAQSRDAGAGVWLMLTDLSEELRAAEVEAAEKLARSILENATEAMVVCDATGRITHASREAHRLLGRSPIGLRFEEAFDLRWPEGSCAQGLPALAGLRGREVRGVEARITCAQGWDRELLVSSGPLGSEAGAGCIVTLTDITATKRAQRELEQLNQTLEERVAERTAVAQRRAQQLLALASELTHAEQRERRRLAKVIHDHLQQLLVAARLNLGVLRGRSRTEEDRKALERIDRLLSESVEASRTLTLELSPPILYEAGLGPAMEWLARWMKQTHGLEVDVEIEAGSEPRAEEVRVLLFEAARELLFNVVKHARSRRAHVGMGVTEEGMIEVIVSDVGVGFDSGAEPRGTLAGFGLFSIRERIELLGGGMEIDSSPGEGTCVTLRVPMLRRGEAAADAAAPAQPQPSIERSENPVGRPRPHSRKIRVMLVDDHAILREGLASLLTAQPDIEVVAQAGDGEAAIQTVHRVQPDVVVMDHTMPGITGVEATRRILAEQPLVQVIGLSLHEASDLATTFTDAGAVAYLPKGGPAEVLIAAIRTCANGHPGKEN